MAIKKRRTVSQRAEESMAFLEELAGPITFGRLLWSIRKGEEMSQTEFAKRLGISKQHLSDLENGRRSISPERAAKFAKKLKYSPQRFVELVLQESVEKAGLKQVKVKLEAV